jgi:ABC-type transport system involved in cytochrome c biogenesis permease subunit
MDPKKHTLFDGKVYELSEHLNLFYRLSTHTMPLVVPAAKDGEQWSSFMDGLEKFPEQGLELPEGADAEAFEVYRTLLIAYDQGDVAGFNSKLAEYIKVLESQGKLKKTNIEVFFNEFAPFFWCWWAYVLAALLAGLSWLDTTWSQPMRKAGFAMMAVTSIVHLTGLILRMYLQDRMFVFVTNLYSSAIFIGLGCVIVSMIAEWFYANGISIVVGSVTGFCTLIIAHLLSYDGDTMIMMQAVLDTNFWLATHVTTVTLGYTMAFVAGFMGVAYILLGMFTDKLRHGVASDLSRATYGVLCGGMFLSFVGTVLGGLWADYSWGRFWGWDPKENGALLIVIWVALILHARWGGLVKQRGIAVLSVLGIIITAWSWFGTNFLGVGLHAYGGAKGAQMLGMVMIDFGFLAIAGLGMLPLEMWQSFRPLSAAGAPPSAGTPPSTGITKAKPKLA